VSAHSGGWHERAEPEGGVSDMHVEEVGCGEHCYPQALAQMRGAPRALYVAGGAERLGRLLREPAVAVVGTRRASDYGMETARALARGLAASGVSVLGALADGIAAAAHMGALEVRGPTVTVMKAGLDICYPASRRALYARVCEVGCAVSELPCGSPALRWSQAMRMRVLVGMAQMVLVVESEESGDALAAARMAQMLGRTVAAVPGRVSARASSGPHALLREGAYLVRDAQDALDALYGVGGRQAPQRKLPLEPVQRELLEQVAGGRDTLGKLSGADGEAGGDARETLATLTELELMGALVRGDGGRYVPRG